MSLARQLSLAREMSGIFGTMRPPPLGREFRTAGKFSICMHPPPPVASCARAGNFCL
jgi:hypothetical protein